MHLRFPWDIPLKIYFIDNNFKNVIYPSENQYFSMFQIRKEPCCQQRVSNIDFLKCFLKRIPQDFSICIRHEHFFEEACLWDTRYKSIYIEDSSVPNKQGSRINYISVNYLINRGMCNKRRGCHFFENYQR